MTKIVRKSEFVSLNIERHRINGKPTCMAWYGGDGKRRRCCRFLTFVRFGTIPVCAALGQELNTDSPIIPAEQCPLWHNKG